MEHLESDFAPIRKSQKVVDSDKIVRAINDDLEQKNFTILQKLSLVPIKESLKGTKVSKPRSVKRQVNLTVYRDFKSKALDELSANYSSVGYIPGLDSFLTNDLGEMRDHVVFFNQIKNIHQYAGIDREVSGILSSIGSNVVIVEMNDYLTKGIFPLDKLKVYIRTNGKRQLKAHFDFKINGNTLDDTFDLMMILLRKIGQNLDIGHIVYFRFEQLDESSPSNTIIPSKLMEFIKILSSLQKIENIAFKFLFYSNNSSVSSLLSTALKKNLSTKPIIFQCPVLTPTQVQEHLKKMIKFTSYPKNELQQSYNLFIIGQLNTKNSNLAKFLEFLKNFPHPFTYLFGVFTEILVQSKTFDELLDMITNRLTTRNYPHRSYNFKKNQRLPLKVARDVHQT
ncbi:hypothetical protein SEUBUCD646_0L04900 [Saccharomyces eubayanus]|uniref:RIF2-like protein n=1 Tax=Saccharomyces eubayanus TaxID=1080349 RepID=A0ABN8VGJ8_SACEU|nr:hypothetical protein SEUBUCD650_0L04890 [Saccharomyces eubayanus]CAI1636959.1 hypothetical protein SEUBUCD646_0L04900 [Saccharomyces eubayanus]